MQAQNCEKNFPKVLLVDDRPENLLALEVVLKGLPCELVKVSSGKEAIAYSISNKVAVVLLDIQMPDMDGYAVSEAIRRNPFSEVTPIIFISAIDQDTSYVEKAYASGATAFMSKPINSLVLQGKVRYFLKLFNQIELSNQLNINARIAAEDEKSKLLENSLDAVVGASANEAIIYWNRHAEMIFGWSKEEALGRPMAELIVPEKFRSAHRRGMTHFLTTGESKIQNRRIEVPALKKSGEEFMIELTVTSMKTPEGSYRFYSFIRDISDRVLARQAIEDEKKLQTRFQRSAKAASLGVWYCDLPFDELMWNEEVKGHFFLTPDAKVTLDTFLERIDDADRERVSKAVTDAVENKAPYDTIFHTMNPSNPSEKKAIRSVGWVDYDEDGKAIRFDGVTIDLTSLVRQNTELEKAKFEAERANQLKSAFVANMSHEIRTPMGAMLGFTELLKDPGLTTTERNNYLDIILRNGESLLIIINDVLDLSKVEAGHLTLESLKFSVAEVIADVISLMTVKAKEKDLALDFTIDPSCEINVCTDPNRLKQILLNLVGNAVKFTQYGYVRLAVKSFKESGNSFLSFEVSDSGIGIPQEDRERIFDVFTQAEESITRRFGGTGLGLALSRRLARILGGDLVLVKSVEGKGSTFGLTIENKLTDKDRANREAAERLSFTLPANALDGLKILIVDDSPDNQLLIWTYLHKFGATTESALDGLKGCKKALTGKYDLVLMDIQMPDMDGYTATRELRSKGFTKPIVALTAHAMSEVKKKCEAAGCTAHLSKPIQLKELVSSIYELTGRASAVSAKEIQQRDDIH